MAIKPPLQKILQGIPHTEYENKPQMNRKYQSSGDEQTSTKIAALNWLQY
jgi:hypothetical protein